MTIKSLLLGSAAALAAVSGAQAADAIVAAEPEPMEYVKVCDAAGAGYFYIPGSETCIRFNGLLRYEVNGFTSASGITDRSPDGVAVAGQRVGYWHHTRFRFEVSAWNDSEYGPVSSWIRIQGDRNNGWLRTNTGTLALNASPVSFQMSFGIAGLEFGSRDNQWLRFFGYGGLTDFGGDFGFNSTQQYISYTADFGAGSAFVSLDNNSNTPGHFNNAAPSVAGGVKGTFGNFGAGLGVGLDTTNNSFAAKGYVNGSFDPITVKLVGLYTNNAANFYSNGTRGFTTILGAQAALTETLSASADFTYRWTPRTYLINADLNWAVADGFSVLTEINYHSNSRTVGGMLRMQRTF